jgi:hypothetical protein
VQADVDLRPGGAEVAQEGGEDAHADRLVGADTERAGLADDDRRDVSPRCVQPGDDRLGVLDERRADLGEDGGPPTAGAVEDRGADDAFEHGDLLADRRLGVAECRRRGGERALACDRSQGGQMAELEPEPVIRFHELNGKLPDWR